MKEYIAGLIQSAVDKLKASGELPEEVSPKITIDNTRDKSHGDFASNVALTLAKPAGKAPRQIAERLCSIILEQAISDNQGVEKAEIAGPGFINFFVSNASSFAVVPEILTGGEVYGRSNTGKNQKVQVEFVSANPTGPLHVGHGRGAAYGATVADLLEAAGFDVQREYYVNDAGRQMNILATSIWLRYLELQGETFTFPCNGYKGDYVYDIARRLSNEYGDKLQHAAETVFENIPADEPAGGDKEVHIDALIARCKALLGENDYLAVFDSGLDNIVGDIKDDLGGFGVNYQKWFSEKSLADSIDGVIEQLDKSGHLYEKEGAIWFRSTEFGDDKDRVVKRDNGETTYFASDIAYHKNKFERGFTQVINIWGADHHGYIARVKAALEALGLNPEKLTVKLVQFAILYRGTERVQMSTRSGSFVTLRELREEVSNDAARFFYVTRKAEQHMDFDLELAKSESKDNPVYYIQYAHARICSVLRKLAEQNTSWNKENGLANLELLTLEHERDLASKLSKYPEMLNNAAINLEPHTLTHYLKELAADFHTYYNAHKMLVEDEKLRDARIALGLAVRQVIANGLKLLGVSAPEEM
ncbi:arginine--tRNA ligase [Alkalimarinus alittae]|uniref:Arginine--tRNA ligase n=1 Tax=Alkalimarinus alittae TaxID=2961619 RepID=A0ABY6N0W0_9ALTE|nr:arginine--tRNA ligase [Alkalimarinus alittae]UZE95735.1 arginine--tRNA ligase [Alkalimarinus alittae]